MQHLLLSIVLDDHVEAPAGATAVPGAAVRVLLGFVDSLKMMIEIYLREN